jgi:hypothetical protein
MEYQDIHKEIYKLPEIRKGFKPILSSWILTIIGVICGYIYITMPNLPTGLSSWMLGFMCVGIFCIALIICFYIFGDCRFPYYKPSKELLEPTQTYYANTVKDSLIEALKNKDEEALSQVKTNTTPQVILVRFSDKHEKTFYSQLMKQQGDKLVPVSEIYINILNK